MANDKPKVATGPFGLLPTTEDWSLEPPETRLDDSDEKRKKSISRTKQWKEFVAFARQRQELYRRQVPGGAYYNQMTKDDAAHYGGIGNAVMGEYDLLIGFIEGGE